ncbi:hypothetical protein Syun_009659 [Stephania yunnanensis]|uniref:Transmembrane protein n=1 Tax=Stephania yunnanensis TaxID=152371 RepID=A0AAP0KHJ9_9MAGN
MHCSKENNEVLHEVSSLSNLLLSPSSTKGYVVATKSTISPFNAMTILFIFITLSLSISNSSPLQATSVRRLISSLKK